MKRRFAGPDLRPYLPTRSGIGPLAAGIGAGTAVIVRHGWRWVWAEGRDEAAVRGGSVALAVGIAGYEAAAGPWLPYCGCGAAAVWVLAALAVAPPRPATAPVVDEEVPEDDGEELTLAEVVAAVRTVAARHGHSGAHLADLLAEPVFEGWEQADLKASLVEDFGVPVGQLKLTVAGRQRVRDGVRLRDLPTAPASTPSGARMGAAEHPAPARPGGPPEAAPEPSPTADLAPAQGGR